MKEVDLKAIAKERGLQGYSKLKKAELITFPQNNLQPLTKPTPALCTRPPRPTRPPPPPPTWEPIDDRPRPTLLSVRPPPNLRPYQPKPKRGKETLIEPPIEQEPPPTSNQTQIKCMKKKLGKLNKKIIHSKKKQNNLISKQNSIKKKIEELKGPREPEPEESFNPIEGEQAFGRAYRSYRINGRPRMDVDTFFNRIRQNLIDLMDRELGSATV